MSFSNADQTIISSLARQAWVNIQPAVPYSSVQTKYTKIAADYMTAVNCAAKIGAPPPPTFLTVARNPSLISHLVDGPQSSAPKTATPKTGTPKTAAPKTAAPKTATPAMDKRSPAAVPPADADPELARALKLSLEDDELAIAIAVSAADAAEQKHASSRPLRAGAPAFVPEFGSTLEQEVNAVFAKYDTVNIRSDSPLFGAVHDSSVDICMSIQEFVGQITFVDMPDSEILVRVKFPAVRPAVLDKYTIVTGSSSIKGALSICRTTPRDALETTYSVTWWDADPSKQFQLVWKTVVAAASSGFIYQRAESKISACYDPEKKRLVLNSANGLEYAEVFHGREVYIFKRGAWRNQADRVISDEMLCVTLMSLITAR